MTDQEVRILTHDEYPIWDQLIKKSHQGTIFHTSTWRSTCAELSSKKETLYGFFENGTLIAGCAIYSDQRYPFLSTAVSTEPMTSYGGYFFSPFNTLKIRQNEQHMRTIYSAINDEILKKFDYINIINSPEISDIRPFLWNGWKASVYYTYYFDLDNHSAENFPKNIRWTIRKAQKLGLIVKKETDPDLNYMLLCKTFKKQHLPPPVHKNSLIKMITMIISNNFGEMWIARTPTGDPVAAEIVIWDNKRAYRWSAVSDEHFKDTGAPSLLLSEIFQDLQKRGFHEINMMGGNRPRLTTFVSGFNPRIIPYYGVEKMNQKYAAIHMLKNLLKTG